MQWDLGGATYEMAIRDYFRIDVLARLAASLQQVDAELGEVERLVRLEDAGAAGECSRCGALHSRGAAYCWQCGQELMASAEMSSPRDTSEDGGEGPRTAVAGDTDETTEPRRSDEEYPTQQISGGAVSEGGRKP